MFKIIFIKIIPEKASELMLLNRIYDTTTTKGAAGD